MYLPVFIAILTWVTSIVIATLYLYFSGRFLDHLKAYHPHVWLSLRRRTGPQRTPEYGIGYPRTSWPDCFVQRKLYRYITRKRYLALQDQELARLAHITRVLGILCIGAW